MTCANARVFFCSQAERRKSNETSMFLVIPNLLYQKEMVVRAVCLLCNNGCKEQLIVLSIQ